MKPEADVNESAGRVKWADEWRRLLCVRIEHDPGTKQTRRFNLIGICSIVVLVK